MDLKLTRVLADELEKNISTVYEALKFAEPLAEKYQDGYFETIESALIVYYEFHANAKELKKFLHTSEAENVYSKENRFTFNAEADFLIKAIDSELNLLCDALMLNPPPPPPAFAKRVRTRFASLRNWHGNEPQNLIEAMNISKLAGHLCSRQQ